MWVVRSKLFSEATKGLFNISRGYSKKLYLDTGIIILKKHTLISMTREKDNSPNSFRTFIKE